MPWPLAPPRSEREAAARASGLAKTADRSQVTASLGGFDSIVRDNKAGAKSRPGAGADSTSLNPGA